jgi:CBS domain-containing protein
LRLLAHGELGKEGPTVPVSDVMKSDLVTVGPETSTLEAIRLMRSKGIGCLPVVHDGRLVGIVTERDFMDITSQLLDQKLQE